MTSSLHLNSHPKFWSKAGNRYRGYLNDAGCNTQRYNQRLPVFTRFYFYSGYRRWFPFTQPGEAGGSMDSKGKSRYCYRDVFLSNYGRHGNHTGDNPSLNFPDNTYYPRYFPNSKHTNSYCHYHVVDI